MMILVPPVSTSHDILIGNFNSQLEQMGLLEPWISCQEILDRKAIMLAHYHLQCQLLTQFENKAKTFFDRTKIARQLKEKVIPALVAMDSEYETLRQIKNSLGKGFSVEVAEKKFQNWSKMPGDPPLSKDNKIISIVQAINDFLCDQCCNFTLLLAKVTNDTYTIGVAKILDWHCWKISEAVHLSFYRVQIMHPLIIPSHNIGLNDRYLGFCWVNMFACTFSAQEIWLCKAWREKISFLRCNALLYYTDWYKSPESFDLALQQCAACEEMQHRINDERFVKNGQLQSYADVFVERAKHPLLLHFWQQCADQKERLKLAVSIEEVNAKLASIAFGPDPKLDIALIDNAGWQAGMTLSEAYKLPNEWEILVSILSEGITYMGSSASRVSYLLGLEVKTLRLIAYRALREIFLDNFQNTPFCSLNDKGELCRFEKTHPFFAGWADRDERSVWQKIKSFFWA